jgi:Na+/H+ antiporter NhaD/arsenite permease-like protein
MAADILLALLLFIYVFALIVSEQLPRSVGAMFGAVLFIIFELVSLEGVIETLGENANALGLIIGMFIIVDITNRAGVFQYLAIRLIKISKGDPDRILVLFCVAALITPAVLSNVATMVILATLTLTICRAMRLNPAPFLISEAIMVNVGGILTLVASVPSIIVGSAADYSFAYFILSFAPLGMILGIILIQFLRYWFKDSLEKIRRTNLSQRTIEALDEWSVVENRGQFMRSTAILSVVIGFFLFGNAVGGAFTSPGFVAICGAVFMLLFSGTNPEHVLKEIDWASLFFFAGLYAVVRGAEDAGLLVELANQLATIAGGDLYIISLLLLWIGGITSAIIDNIPTAITFTTVIGDMAHQFSTLDPLWWGALFGTVLGGNFTPLASPAGILVLGHYDRTVTSQIKKRKFFRDFFIAGSLAALITMLCATLYLILYIFLFS